MSVINVNLSDADIIPIIEKEEVEARIFIYHIYFYHVDIDGNKIFPAATSLHITECLLDSLMVLLRKAKYDTGATI